MAASDASGRICAVERMDPSADRLIESSRLVVASVGLLGIWLDPGQPSDHAGVTYAILLGYLAVGAALAALPFLFAPLAGRAGWATHLFDVAAVAALMRLTEGPTTPLFVFFTFVLFAATLRWSWEGPVGTALVLAILFVLFGTDPEPGPPSGRELLERALGSGYLLLAGGLFAYFGHARERSVLRLRQLAAWPADAVADGDDPPLEGVLAHALEVIGAKRALVIWEVEDEPYQHHALCSREGCSFRRVGPVSQLAVCAPMRDRTFLLLGRSRPQGWLYYCRDSSEFERGSQLRPAILEEYAIQQAAVTPLRGRRISGTLLLLEPSHATEGLLSLTEIVASRLAVEIDRHMLRRDVVAAGRLERVRLARDLHDTVLQELAAVQLQIKAIVPEVPETLRTRINDLGQLLAGQQRRIRALVESHQHRGRRANYLLRSEVQELLGEISRLWGCETELEIDPPEATVRRRLGTEIAMIISEAAANAVRHGRARRISVTITQRKSVLITQIRDNGAGTDAVRNRLLEPERSRSIFERVEELGGSITASRLCEGLELSMEIPLP